MQRLPSVAAGTRSSIASLEAVVRRSALRWIGWPLRKVKQPLLGLKQSRTVATTAPPPGELALPTP